MNIDKCRIKASEYSTRAANYWQRLSPKQRGKLMLEIRKSYPSFAGKTVCQKYRSIMLYIDANKLKKRRR